MLNNEGGDPVTIDAVIALLRDDRMRGFKIDVETDSLVEADQDAEKQRRVEFVTAVGEYIGKVGPLAVEMPPLAPLVGGMLQFAVRGFKVGSELEDLIEKTMDDIQASLANPQPPPIDPTVQAKLEGEKLKAQVELQKADMEAQQSQADQAAKMAQMQAQMEMEREKHALEMEKMRMEMARDREKFQIEMDRADMGLSIDLASKQADYELKAKESDRRASAEKQEGDDSEDTKSVLKELVAKVSGKRKLVRGDDGELLGIEEDGGNFRQFSRGKDGSIEGVD